MKNKSKKQNINKEISATPVIGEPENVFELINKYGTYEIQPTADTDNEFPAIAQGNYRNKKDLKTNAQSETKN